MRLKNKTAVVTGSSTGIGYAIAKAFNNEGANVVFSDINEIENFVANEKTSFVKCDVSKSEEIDNLISETISKFGSLDIMVNNAGIGSLGDIITTDNETWNKVLAINLSGTFYGMRASAKYMKENMVNGSIINISSILGGVGFKGALAYCASKGGVVQLTHAGALDLADAKIRVNAIAPGFIETNMTKVVKENQQFNQLVTDNTPMKHMGKPEDIASTAVYLASDESKFTTGEVIYVDGGWMAR
jgi:3-oxoacyl-[acyl-carrier protein] reductase